MIASYQNKPVVIQAVRWTGDNLDEVLQLGDVVYSSAKQTISIVAPEGVLIAYVNDYIIKDINGDLHPCKCDLFESTYEIIQ